MIARSENVGVSYKWARLATCHQSSFDDADVPVPLRSTRAAETPSTQHESVAVLLQKQLQLQQQPLQRQIVGGRLRELRAAVSTGTGTPRAGGGSGPS